MAKKNKDKKGKFDKYSTDADKSRYLLYMFILALFVTGGFMALEFFHPEVEHTPMIFTQEVVYITINGVILGFVGLGTFLYGRQSGIAEGMMRAYRENGHEPSWTDPKQGYQPPPQTPTPQPKPARPTTPTPRKGRLT